MKLLLRRLLVGNSTYAPPLIAKAEEVAPLRLVVYEEVPPLLKTDPLLLPIWSLALASSGRQVINPAVRVTVTVALPLVVPPPQPLLTAVAV